MANKFNFEQLKKHTEYSLQYELKDLVTNDVVVFDIKPKMDDRTAFLELISNKKTKPHQIVNWFSELVFRTEEATEEEKSIFEDFAMSHYGEIQTQTMVGFKLTTKEDLDKRMSELSEKVMEKNLI